MARTCCGLPTPPASQPGTVDTRGPKLEPPLAGLALPAHCRHLAKEHEMRTFGLALLAAAAIATLATQALAHGSAPHPKCKKGYTLDASHKCIKAART
jgi:hypothetical protein